MLSSCASTSASTFLDFTPYSVTTQGLPQIVDSCQLGYFGDTKYLLASGAVEIGTAYVSGNAHADEGDIRKRALAVCPHNGGTHVIFLKKGESVSYEQVTPTKTTYNAVGDAVVATTTPGISVPVTRPNGEFRIFRVEAARIAELPGALQPKMLSASEIAERAQARPALAIAGSSIVERSERTCCRALKLTQSVTETSCAVPSAKAGRFRKCVAAQRP